MEKAEASGDGGYDAFMNALKKAAKHFKIEIPMLADYRVRIPPGGRTTALVETHVSWRIEGTGTGRKKTKAETFSTLGVDSDQMAAAVIATEKMLNAIAVRNAGSTTRKTTKARTRKTAATSKKGRSG